MTTAVVIVMFCTAALTGRLLFYTFDRLLIYRLLNINLNLKCYFARIYNRADFFYIKKLRNKCIYYNISEYAPLHF